MNEKIKNKYWDSKKTPFITVMTPVYNRRTTLERTLASVQKQTFRDIEYIIVDDGSTELADDIVKKYMDSTDLPVMYIKKRNGGVHTARNVGYKEARGELILCIDSDDELLPEACKILHDVWTNIPKGYRDKYWQIKAQCRDVDGKITGTLFPDGINKMPIEKARKFFSLSKGEQIGCRVAKIMKENLFPEPDGVTFVTENILWVPLEKKYRSYGINDAIRIYHKEGNDHLSKGSAKKTKQDLRNLYWNTVYRLNDWATFGTGLMERIKSILRYCVLLSILSKYGDRKFTSRYKLKGFLNNLWKTLLWVPSCMVALVYYKKKCIKIKER